MARSLSPKEAAERLAITVGTLRRWEREGIIDSDRTPGGQRRYREADIAGLLGAPPQVHPSRASSKSIPSSDLDESPGAEEPLPREAPAWEQRVNEERAELEVLKLRREQAALIQADREQILQRQRDNDLTEQRVREAQRELARRNADSERETRRLESLRQYGRSLANDAPAAYQAAVARDLLKSVNPQSYPVEIEDRLAKELVAGRVAKLLRPWREKTERQRARSQAEGKIAELVSEGQLLASLETLNWDFDEAERAEREVQRALKRTVRADWTHDDVRALVEDVLDLWEDEDE